MKTKVIKCIAIMVLVGTIIYLVFSHRKSDVVHEKNAVDSGLCDYNGKRYEVGDMFKQDCNECKCTALGLECTLGFCVDSK